MSEPDPDEFKKIIEEIDISVADMERLIGAGEVTSPAVITMARGLRKALDHYFQSGNDGGPASTRD